MPVRLKSFVILLGIFALLIAGVIAVIAMRWI